MASRYKRARAYLNRFKKTVTWPYLARAGALAIIYIVMAKLGLSFAFGTEQVTTVWPPTGIALAALLILGYRYWPGILIGAFIANILTNETPAIAAGIAVGNTLEALTGTFLLRHVIKFDLSFSRTGDFFGLLSAGVACTAISATIGTSSLALGSLLNHSYLSTWLIWWVGDLMGALVFAPLILIFASNKFKALRQNPTEAIFLLILSTAVCLLIFGRSDNPLVLFPYLVFPLIIWASLRFTQAGAVVIINLVAAIAIWGTVDKLGPFTAYNSADRNLILLHTFILVAAVTAMLTAITAYRQQQTEEALRNRNKQLKVANLRVKNLLTGALGKRFTKLQAKVGSERPKT
ncbi:MAG TPA: MASE1 domain-containing protein [Candidatus Saccharimonadales bacterium]|nr:MASE1 domain-containing protein [Candidatus Saccharimonadales bacterium]